MNVGHSLLWCVLTAVAVPGAERPASVSFAHVPELVAAGESFSVHVHYQLKPGLTSQLNVELKNAENEVLHAARRQVAGTGTARTAFNAPVVPQPLQVAAWVGTDWRRALSPIVHIQLTNVLSPKRAAARRAVLDRQRRGAAQFLKTLGPLPKDKYAIALLRDPKLPSHDPKLADDFAQMLRKAGHEVTLINADLLCNPHAITTDRFDMLFLPSCHTLPGDAGPVIKRYCDKGGDLAALGTPAFRHVLAKVGGQWVSQEGWRKLLQEQPTQHVLFSFDGDDRTKWERHTNAPKSPITCELVPGKKGKALHVAIPQMGGWDGYASPKLDEPFPPDNKLTCLWAKGAGETDRLMLEWREKDGSRWIATFPVGHEWRRVVLAPGDFHFWQSVKHRGFAGDTFKPENAVQCVLGVAHTHTGHRSGHYEFLIDELGTAPATADTPEFLSPPILENFSPSYKFYELDDMDYLHEPGSMHIVGGQDVSAVPSRAYGHHPRPGAGGWGKGRTWRWRPLLCAWRKRRDSMPRQTGDRWRGAVVSLYVDSAVGSVRLAIGVDDVGWYRGSRSTRLITEATDTIAIGLFLLEGGPEFYAYRPSERVRIGATVLNLSRHERRGLAVVLDDASGSGLTYVVDPPPSLGPGQSITSARDVPLDRDGALILSELDQARVNSTLTEVRAYTPEAVADRKFVTVREGDFWLDGKRWYPHGVNYMPSSGIGTEDHEYFEYWMGAKPYDPEIIQRDLERCKAMGLNSVSIFIYHRSLGANNLLDFLRRCDESPLNLKVNLSIRPGTPMDADYWPKWKEIIERNRLWEFDVIWAYDIAWEPFFGADGSWRQYDGLWREWVVKKYGTLDAARKAWGRNIVGGVSTRRDQDSRDGDIPPTKKAGEEVTCPTGWQLTHDGPHRKFVADYRHFVDELVHQRYKLAYDRIKSIDPHHLISFRMTVTGDPTYNWDRKMPYDFKGVCRAMDFLAPEGYGRIGDWERVKPGMFTVAYARMCAQGKPVFWAEAGVSAWDNARMESTPEKLAFQGRYFRDYYKMMLASHSNGIAWWWYPGGYRVGERSDYGIINPDGTDRPVTKVIREHAKQFTAERVIPKPNYWITVDRDADARGLHGIYEKVKDEYWRAIEAGKVVGLREKTRDP